MPVIQPWHKTQLLEPDYNRVDLVKEGANSQAKIKLFKSKGEPSMTFEEILKSLKPEHASVIEDVIKAKDKDIEEKDKAAAKATADLKKVEEEKAANPFAKSKTEDMTQEEILKSVKDPAVKLFLEQQIAKTKVAEDEIRKARETALTAESIAKAKEVPGIGAEETALADVYKKLKTVDGELANEVFGIFKAASAMINSGGVFTEVGKSTEGAIAGDEDSAWGQIEAKATEIAKASNISQASAISKTISDHPELYDAYLKAQRG
jgi:hypothetical protein